MSKNEVDSQEASSDTWKDDAMDGGRIGGRSDCRVEGGHGIGNQCSCDPPVLARKRRSSPGVWGGGVFGVPAGKNEPELAARDAAMETELGAVVAAVAAVAAGPGIMSGDVAQRAVPRQVEIKGVPHHISK